MSRSTLTLIAFLLAAPLHSACALKEANCEQCGRTECRNMAFVIRHTDGREVKTCCPRCGLHYLETEHSPVAALSVHDFETGAAIDAERALYVEGSDITPCLVAGKRPLRDASGCCADPVYDRCLPSLIAFRSKEEAAAFAREHGGAVRAFGEIGGQRP